MSSRTLRARFGAILDQKGRGRIMRRPVIFLGLALLACLLVFIPTAGAAVDPTGTALASLAVGGSGETSKKTFEYAIGLWGDLPYSDAQATAGVPNLIADMNGSSLEFSVHDGDLKAGSGTLGSVTPTTCSDALYAQGLRYFDALDAAAMFTPGDNDWTDCDRPANGGYNSLERLDHERQVFFSTPSSLGRHPILQAVQATPDCLGLAGPTPCVENRRWTLKGVTYATVNVQGSCNNLCDTAPDPAEYAARNAADIAWLEQTFAEAEAKGSAGVMIISQADPGFDTTGAFGAPKRDPKTLVETDPDPDGFHDFLVSLRAQTIAFGKPVVYVHGDSHYFRIDKPLLDAQGRRLENFTRVETFGDNAANGLNDVHWVKALVDPYSRDVFAFQPQIVPANRTAVPAPAAVSVSASAVTLTPARPKAGRPFSATVRVSAGGAPVRPTGIACAGTIGSTKLKGVGKAASGAATCVYRTRKGAKGKTLQGTISFSALGKKFTKRFATKLG